MDQMEAVKRLNAEQAKAAHAEIDQILGGKKPEEAEDEAE